MELKISWKNSPARKSSQNKQDAPSLTCQTKCLEHIAAIYRAMKKEMNPIIGVAATR